MSSDLSKVFAQRRSIYHIGNQPVIPQDKITEIIENALKNCPTAFNSQSARLVLLYGENYQKFWEITMAELKKVVPADKFEPTYHKIKSFAAGLGTVLFFEDSTTTEELQKKFPPYRENFPIWALQGNGILEYMIWIALHDAGIGASLQHYNPLVDEAVYTTWNIPKTWKLIAQMPFGSIEEPAGPKTFLPLEERIKVFY